MYTFFNIWEIDSIYWLQVFFIPRRYTFIWFTLPRNQMYELAKRMPNVSRKESMQRRFRIKLRGINHRSRQASRDMESFLRKFPTLYYHFGILSVPSWIPTFGLRSNARTPLLGGCQTVACRIVTALRKVFLWSLCFSMNAWNIKESRVIFSTKKYYLHYLMFKMYFY